MILHTIFLLLEPRRPVLRDLNVILYDNTSYQLSTDHTINIYVFYFVASEGVKIKIVLLVADERANNDDGRKYRPLNYTTPGIVVLGGTAIVTVNTNERLQ